MKSDNYLSRAITHRLSGSNLAQLHILLLAFKQNASSSFSFIITIDVFFSKLHIFCTHHTMFIPFGSALPFLYATYCFLITIMNMCNKNRQGLQIEKKQDPIINIKWHFNLTFLINYIPHWIVMLGKIFRFFRIC